MKRRKVIKIGKIKKTFYIDKRVADLLRDYSYQTRKPMGVLVEEAIKFKLLKKEDNNVKSIHQE